eukprot:g14070.t1
MENLRPSIVGVVQAHTEYQILALAVRVQCIETALDTTFTKLSRSGVITLHDLRGSDFFASLNAVGRRMMRLEETVYFSPSEMLATMHTGYQRHPFYQSGRGSAGSGVTVQPHKRSVPVINAPTYIRSHW